MKDHMEAQTANMDEHDKVEELVDSGAITEEEAEDLHQEFDTSDAIRIDDEQETKKES